MKGENFGYWVAVGILGLSGAQYYLSGDFTRLQEQSREFKAERLALSRQENKQRIAREQELASAAIADTRYREFCVVLASPDYRQALNLVPGEQVASGELNGVPRLLAEGTTICDDRGWTGKIGKNGILLPESMARSLNAKLYNQRVENALIGWKPATRTNAAPQSASAPPTDESTTTFQRSTVADRPQ